MKTLNKKTILVSGASGVVGYGILKSLRQADKNLQLIGTTIYETSAAQYFSDIFEKALMTSDENYFDWLLGLIKKYKIDLLIPSIEIDMFAWSENRELIESSGCKVVLNNPDLIELCKDKWIFYLKLKECHSKYAIPTFMEYNEKLPYPYLLKPRRGFASQGIIIINSKEDLLEHQSCIGETHMMQPIIGTKDEEYTVSGFFDKNSHLCTYMGLKRKLAKEGFTEKAETVEIKGIEEALTELAEIFKPVGPTNFQFRVDNGELKLLEINPRISSATSLRTAFGYNESEMCVDYFLNDVLPGQLKIRSGHAVRYTEDIIYYDDCYNL